MTKDTEPEVKDIFIYLAEGKTGPTKASVLVMRLVEAWETKYRAKYDGMDAGTWLRKTFGKGAGLVYFQRRHKAALRFSNKTNFDAKNWLRELASGSVLCLDHEALIWLDSVVKVSDTTKMSKAVCGEYIVNAQQPLTREQVERVYTKTIGKRPRKMQKCVNCAVLQKEIAELKAVMLSKK